MTKIKFLQDENVEVETWDGQEFLTKTYWMGSKEQMRDCLTQIISGSRRLIYGCEYGVAAGFQKKNFEWLIKKRERLPEYNIYYNWIEDIVKHMAINEGITTKEILKQTKATGVSAGDIQRIILDHLVCQGMLKKDKFDCNGKGHVWIKIKAPSCPLYSEDPKQMKKNHRHRKWYVLGEIYGGQYPNEEKETEDSSEDAP